jgi:hypothetical protein
MFLTNPKYTFFLHIILIAPMIQYTEAQNSTVIINGNNTSESGISTSESGNSTSESVNSTSESVNQTTVGKTHALHAFSMAWNLHLQNVKMSTFVCNLFSLSKDM